MMYAALFLLGALAMLLFRRLIGTVLRFLLMGLVVVVSGQLALMADDRLTRPSWVIGGIIGGVAAFIVVGVLSYAIIYHMFLADVRRRAVDRAVEDEKRNRLW